MKIDARPKKEVIIYQAKSGAIELRGDFAKETVWATQAQIVSLFDVDQSVISRHIRNIFKDKEIDEKSNMQKMHIAYSDKPVALYSLDVILAVGYRTNSKIAIAFRQWATKTLRAHIVYGYTINRTRLAKQYELYQQAVQHLERIAPNTTLDTKSVLDLIKLFSRTWISLDAYDKAQLPTSGATKKQVRLAAEEISAAIAELKEVLMQTAEATVMFASEKHQGSLSGIVGNILQSFGGKDLYSTVEEKAAHLLYFIVKDHPFNDGNKRSGAFVFIWYLQKANILSLKQLTPEALTALTLLVAESNPKDKEQVVGLILLLLKK